MMISNYQLSINSNNDLGNIHSRDLNALPQEDSVQVYSINNQDDGVDDGGYNNQDNNFNMQIVMQQSNYNQNDDPNQNNKVNDQLAISVIPKSLIDSRIDSRSIKTPSPSKGMNTVESNLNSELRVMIKSKSDARLSKH